MNLRPTALIILPTKKTPSRQSLGQPPQSATTINYQPLTQF
jgi:hypothetical protein